MVKFSADRVDLYTNVTINMHYCLLHKRIDNRITGVPHFIRERFHLPNLSKKMDPVVIDS